MKHHHSFRSFDPRPAKIVSDEERAERWATRICESVQQSVETIIATGELIADAKADLPHGHFMAMVKDKLPFGDRTARMLMRIAADPRIANRNHGSVLPSSWRTLHELTKLDDEQFSSAIADGTINPNMERNDIAARFKAEKRAAAAIEVNPQKSNMAIAKDIGVSEATVRRARPATSSDGAVRIGLDGKARKLPSRPEPINENEITDGELAKEQFLFLSRSVLETADDTLLFIKQMDLSKAGWQEVCGAVHSIIEKWSAVEAALLVREKSCQN
jgi:hypothetical protein